MRLSEIFKNTSYGDSLFTDEEIAAVEARIVTRETKGKETPFINCLVRDKEIKLTPEEIVRQLYIYRLMNLYGYPSDRLRVEFAVNFGREVKRADVVVMDKLNPTAAYIIVEVKKPKLKDGKEQLKSYTNATGAPISVWTNGEQISAYHRKDPNYFEQLTDIPEATAKLSDILNERITYEELKRRDKIANEKRSLRDLIIEIEDEVLANAGVDSFEEVFKLIFSKLYDEYAAANDPNYWLKFRNSGDTDSELYAKVDELFKAARKKWNGIFPDSGKIELTPSHLSICVSTLQDVKLFNNNLDVVDDAFEYLMNKSQKGEKGQYFTPRYVIDMCVKMMNPQEGENVIDTAAGSSGFPVHSIFHVWRNIRGELGLPVGEGFTTDKRTERETAFVRDHIFAIDFDEKTVRVARTLNLIAGDGQSNVMHLNTLDYGRWDEVTSQRSWQRNYSAGFGRLLDIRPKGAVENNYSQFSFDLLMANPPFAGDIKEGTILARYELGRNDKGKQQAKVGRDILFIERNLNFLKSGGRMAIVLPQGRFNNSSDKRIRDFIAEHCRILAVVGLHGNVFKPHTGTKTSVLFVQKWDNELCPKVDDYPIFFATMQKSSKDSSGDKIYVLDGETREPKLDNHGHLIVDHDLYNHDGLTEDGIAEAFIEFAKRERLSFFVDARPFDAEKYAALMSGLEISEVKFCEIDLDDRYDAEYFAKEYLELENRLSHCKTDILRNLSKMTASAFYPAATQLYDSGDTPFVRCVDCIAYPVITEQQDDIFEKIPHDFATSSKGISFLKTNDIVITKVGSPCFASIVTDYKEVALSRTVMGLTKIRNIDPLYLMIFLRCRYGFEQIFRQRELTIQYQLTLDRVSRIVVYLPSNSFQSRIATFVENYKQALKNSRNLYAAAKTTLLHALGLENWSAPEPLSYVRNSRDVFAADRFDAEYFQPKFDEVLMRLRERGINMLPLGQIIRPIKNGFDARDFVEDGTPYIRVGDIKDCRICLESIAKVTLEADKINKDISLAVGDVLFTRKGTFGNAAPVFGEHTNAIISSEIMLLRLNRAWHGKILPEFLALFFNSLLGKMQSQKWAHGVAFYSVAQCDLQRFLVPIVELEKQREISCLFHAGGQKNAQAAQLLDTAKRAVEIAIEEGEDKASAWLDEQQIFSSEGNSR